jgi:acyl dehydratase
MSVRGETWYFDDIPLGYVHVFGAAALTAEDIDLFHERFSPPVSVGAEAAQAALKPAAQAHVYALWSRMLWDETKDWPVIARLGQDVLRWYKAARAGDVLKVRLEFVSKQPVADDRGIVVTQHEVLNQHGELVMALMTRTVVARAK